MSGDGWTLYGRAAIDHRGPASCTLTLHVDGTWSADLATFTLAGTCDLLFTSAAGGRFCGPAHVASSRADTEPLRAVTRLAGAGPLLVMSAGADPSELDSVERPEIEGQLVADLQLEVSE